MEVTKAIAESKDFIELFKELEIEIQKVRNAQKPTTVKKTKEADRRYFDWKPFMKWLKDNNFPNIDNFEITFNPLSGHGLTAKKDFKAGELILEVPTKFMMTNKTAVQSKIALLFHNDQILQSVYSLALALHLLMEKKTLNSFWGPYIDSLPRKVPNSPLFWKIDEVLKLRGTHALEELAKLKVSFVKAYCHVYFRLEKQLENAIMKRAQFTYDSFGWAYSVTYSRQNQIYVEGSNKKLVPAFALIPVFDLMNHENGGHITTNYIYEKDLLETTAKRDFKKGEEIKIFYGERPNVEFLINSGFAIPNNPFNYTAIFFSLLESDKLKPKKTEILQKCELPPSGKFALSIENPVQDELLSFLRIAWINKEEELVAAEPIFNTQPVSTQNELKVYTMLELKINQILSNFPTKLEDDKKQIEIAKQSGATHDYLINQILIDEKTILNNALTIIKNKKQLLQQNK
uniref:protein-histidine N-methyltransferase n=1 Tax=Arcella intermedia TaxID=1963864 RepID=A0A6B2L3S4_9EUKA